LKNLAYKARWDNVREPYELLPNQEFCAIIELSNNGTIKWPEDTKLYSFTGYHHQMIVDVSALDPKGKIEAKLNLSAPQKEGK